MAIADGVKLSMRPLTEIIILPLFLGTSRKHMNIAEHSSGDEFDPNTWELFCTQKFPPRRRLRPIHYTSLNTLFSAMIRGHHG